MPGFHKLSARLLPPTCRDFHCPPLYSLPQYPLKNMHNLKVESYVLFSGHSEDFKPGGSLSDSSEGLLQRGKQGARIYRSFATKIRVSEHQKLLLIKENQTSQVKEFSAFLNMGRYKSLGSLKSFL